MKILKFSAVVKNNLPHLTEGSEQSRQTKEIFNAKSSPPKVSNIVTEVRDWWREQIAYSTDTSDEDDDL